MNYPLKSAPKRKTAAFWGLQSSLHCAATIPLHSFIKSPEPTPSSPPQRSLSCAPTMALRTAMLKSAGEKMMSVYGPIRWAHTIAAQPPPLDVSMSPVAVTGPFVLPEYDRDSEYSNGNVGFEFPFFTFGGGSMELMAVPKRKVSPHKRGIRNGPKALKPVPVIVRCKSCGRVKLPHFYCCSGDRGNTGEPNSSSN